MSRESKKAELRQRLYETSLELFRRRGYDNVSVADITREVGVAKGTFFNHFPSKADVLAAWYTAALGPRSGGQPSSFAEALGRVVDERIGVLEAEPELLAAKIAHEATEPALIEAEAALDREVKGTLVEGLRGQLGPGFDPEEVALVALSLLTGVAREWRADPRASLSTMVRERLSVFEKMIARCGP